MGLLKASGLGKKAGTSEILMDIDLDVERGEIFVIIGPTGAGKTTLMRLLALLDNASSGDIYFDGQKVSGPAVNKVRVRRRMGMVFQKPVVFNNSVADNVAYPLKVRGGMGKREMSARVDEMLAAVGMTGYGKRKARTLSGGEMQRVALARAMITAPEILFLDEPTANLDPASAAAIEETIGKFSRGNNLTVMMTTHDLDQGKRLAHRAAVLMQGQIVQVGLAVDIFYSPGDIRVARFIGIRNILHGKVLREEAGLSLVDIGSRTIEVVCNLPHGSAVDIYIRPEEIMLALNPVDGSARNQLECGISSLAFSGPLCTAQLDCGLEALVTVKSAREMGLKEGLAVCATFKATAVRVLPASV